MQKHSVDLVYGVVRWIEPDLETFCRGRVGGWRV